MIGLNLQKFAKTKSQTYAYRAAKRLLKQSMPGQKAEKPVKKIDFRKGRLGDEDIVRREVYTLYQVKDAKDSNEVFKGNATGLKIFEMIDDNKISYDARRKVWVGKKGNYIIRKKRK